MAQQGQAGHGVARQEGTAVDISGQQRDNACTNLSFFSFGRNGPPHNSDYSGLLVVHEARVEMHVLVAQSTTGVTLCCAPYSVLPQQ